MPDRDTGESLTFEQSQERLRELTERSLWQVGSHIPGRAFTDVYRRSDAYYLIHGGPTNSYGLQTMRRDLPATVVARSEPMAALGEALMTELDALDLRPEVPVKNHRFPVLRQAKARSWLDLIKTSATADVVRLGGIFAVGTWVRDRSRLDGVQVPGKDGYAVQQNPTPDELAVALRVACDAVQP